MEINSLLEPTAQNAGPAIQVEVTPSRTLEDLDRALLIICADVAHNNAVHFCVTAWRRDIYSFFDNIVPGPSGLAGWYLESRQTREALVSILHSVAQKIGRLTLEYRSTRKFVFSGAIVSSTASCLSDHADSVSRLAAPRGPLPLGSRKSATSQILVPRSFCIVLSLFSF